MFQSRKVALYDPEKNRHPLLMVPVSLLRADEYDRFDIPKIHPKFDVYGPTRLDDPDATWKIVCRGDEDVHEHLHFARLSYLKGLGLWDGGIKRLLSEKGRKMLIGPSPPALPLLDLAGVGVKGHLQQMLGRLCAKDKTDCTAALLVTDAGEKDFENVSQDNDSKILIYTETLRAVEKEGTRVQVEVVALQETLDP